MLRVLVLVLGVIAWPASWSLAAGYGGTISGELVAIRGTANQFRIVGHGGTFTAPSGTSVQALDGKTVQVEVSNGRVTQITETPVAINPVAHGFATVRGELMVTDPIARRFTFAGDNQVYTAPSGIDISAYAGKLVEAKVDETGVVTELRLVSPGSSYYPAPANPVAANPPAPPYPPPVYAPAPYPPPAATGSCMYYGQTYSAGSAVCQSGTEFRCDGSQWQSLGTPCQSGDGRRAHDTTLPPQSPRSCVVGDATVASGSGICRQGTTYRCDDGAWINIQTACR